MSRHRQTARTRVLDTSGVLSPYQRRRDLERLTNEEFDVLVIGGGITGTGVALDAASRGLSVAIVEARDWAAGTSSRSSKLIHGGLRYLEQLNFPLVREALQERGLLLGTIAPHLVRPVPFLLPLEHRVWQRAYFGAGVALYDWLGTLFGSARGMPAHRHLSRSGARAMFPSLRPDALVGAIRYYDGQVDDARLTIALARTASAYGAAAVSSARVQSLLRTPDGRVEGAVVRDLEGDARIEVRARRTIAATGVWSDDIGRMLAGADGVGSGLGVRVRASKGVHIVVPRSAIQGDAGLILRTAVSVLFVIPWERHWIIGTTDTAWDLDRAHPAASSHDIDYLLRQVNQVLQVGLQRTDIQGVYAGLRPLLAGESDATSKLSREHAVVSPVPGLSLIAGGKYTTYRVMAKDAVDSAAIDLPWVGQSVTHRIPVLGAKGYRQKWKNRVASSSAYRISTRTLEHLLHRYGDQVDDVLSIVKSDPSMRDELPGAPGYLRAEAWFAVAAEGALHLDDVLTRRTRISVETAHRGVRTAPAVAQIMADVLGWTDAVKQREVEHYLARVSAERESQLQLDDRTADAARLGAPDVRGAAAEVG